MALDTFGPRLIEQLISVVNGVAVTPSDTVDLEIATRALYVGVAGDVTVTLAPETTPVVFKNLASGVFHPIKATRVWATGTNATDIVACY